MVYEETLALLRQYPRLKTAQIDEIAKKYLKENVDVSALYPYIDRDGAIFRIYFVVSLKRIKSFPEQLQFIEHHFAHLQDWWHVDILLQLFKKPVPFELVFERAKEYVYSPLPFVRRFGYVLFLSGLQKEQNNTAKILSLFHDDSAYYVQMGAAWLLADLAIYNPELILAFLYEKKLNYNIIGKAIQKMCDSFRISPSYKEEAKKIRALYK